MSIVDIHKFRSGVPIEISDQATCGPLRIGHASFSRRVFKCSVSEVSPQPIDMCICHIDIRKPVLVKISHTRALAKSVLEQACSCRRIVKVITSKTIQTI